MTRNATVRDELARFCARRDDVDADDDARALASVASGVRDGDVRVIDVVVALERELCGIEPHPRARATRALAHVACELAREVLDVQSRHTLSAFFASKLSDYAVIAHAARGAVACVDAGDNEDVEAIANGAFAGCDVQALSQADRERVLEVGVRALHANGAAAVHGAGEGDCEKACASIIAAFDGEKDPRCVLLLSDAWVTLPQAFARCGDEGVAAYAANAEELYDVAASYFPVSFTPPRGDAIKITRRQLAEAVERAMCASPTFAPWAVPHALESLNPELGAQKMADAARAVRAMGRAWGADVMREHLDVIWRAMRAALAHPNATKNENDNIDDMRHATTPMAVMTTMFASEWGGEALARRALEDACVRDAESTLMTAATTKTNACNASGDAMDTGCCGGGCGKGTSDDARGRLVIATAGRVLGAVAAASPALARQVTCVTMKTLLDAACVPSPTTTSSSTLMTTSASYLALILATPALGGALDCCARAAQGDDAGVVLSVLDDESERLVALFASAALGCLGEGDETTRRDGIVLGLAGLHMMCKFPRGFGLASDVARKNTCDKLIDAIMCDDDDDESEEDIEVRLHRAIEALVAAVSGGDDAFIRVVVSAATPRLFTSVSARKLQSTTCARAMRTLSALALANEAIRNDVASFMCGVVRDAMMSGALGVEDVVDACVRDADGVLTSGVSSDAAQKACESLAEFCIERTSSLVSAIDLHCMMRITIAAVANCGLDAQRALATRAFASASSAPLLAAATMCGLRADTVDVATLQRACEDLVRVATTPGTDARLVRYCAAACGSAAFKCPRARFTEPRDYDDFGASSVVRAVVRARAMKRDESPEAQALIDDVTRALGDAETCAERARGAAETLSAATGFQASEDDLALGLKPSTHAKEGFLARQRAFSQLAPVLVERAYASTGLVRLAYSYAAARLAAGVPSAVALRAQFKLFPLLPDVLSALNTNGAFAGDGDALRATLTLVGARLAEQTTDAAADVRGRAASLIHVLCDIAVVKPSTTTKTAAMETEISMECRECALEALIAAATTLTYADIFPLRDAVFAAVKSACDDPKRRVRRAAARARQTWLAIAAA